MSTPTKVTIIAIVSQQNEKRLNEALRSEFKLQSANSSDEALIVLSQSSNTLVLIEEQLSCDIVRAEIIKHQHIAILLSPTPSFEKGVKALQQNYRGYGNLFSHSDRLVAAIRLIQTGEVWLGASITEGFKQLNLKENSKNNDKLMSLTEREYKVAKEATVGSSNRNIAEQLHISERTVKAHLSAVYEKLGAKNRTELIINYKNDFQLAPREL